jgi:predicted PurR-regulated permease PerM
MPGEPLPRESHYDRAGRLFILAALGLALYFTGKVFRPFFSAIAIAAIIAVVFYPLYARLTAAFGGRRALAGGVTVLLVILCLILPVTAMIFVFTKEALELYQVLNAKAADGSLDAILQYRKWEAIEGWLAAHAPWLDAQALNLKGIFLSFLEKISGYGVAVVTAILSNALSALGTFAVVLFSLFFFLHDAEGFGRWVTGLVPLHRDHKLQLLRTFTEIVKSAVLGSGVVALAQGILGGVAFWGVGMRGVLWGAVMAFTSLVPVVGSALVWLPASALLFLQGRPGAGTFLLLWGVLVISSADNVIRIFVVKGPVSMHPLLIFFSVVGGIKLWGLVGVVFGPLAIAMVLALLEIFRGEFIAPPEPGHE